MKATLADLWDELGNGRIVESDLRDPLQHLDGFMDYGTKRVHVNPRPAVVEVLLHELLHRRFPSMSERRVDSEAKRLLCSMSSADVAKWYRQYSIVARRRTRPMHVDPE